MGAIVEFLRILIGLIVWIVVIAFILLFLQGFWKGISEVVEDIFGISKK